MSKLREFLTEIDPDILMVDGHDEAFLGVAQTKDGVIAIYSMDAVIINLMNDDMMSFEDATEFAEFNIFTAYHGPRTPIFVDIIPKDSYEDTV